MNDYLKFIFKDYLFNEQNKTVTLTYQIDEAFTFNEVYTFDFDFVDYDQAALDKAIQQLFFLAGVSYYKTFVPSNIVIQKGTINEQEAAFYSKTYQKGLGEFWYINDLDPNTSVVFPVNDTDEHSALDVQSDNGLLVGLGGGKDSLVVVEALRNSGRNITTWSLNHHSQMQPLVTKIGLKHSFVDRELDPSLIELNARGALNGHIPISAILAATGVVVAVLSGNRDVVVGNESSANEPSFAYQGVNINHQYSKTEEFETDFQQLLRSSFSDSIRYYSFLRPFSELRVAEIFVKSGFSKYQQVFSSCNRAYTLDSDHIFWCGICAKCAFIFLILSPFVDKEKLESLWNGKNLLLDAELIDTYYQLLGISGDKPLDCIGEIKESRSAMRLAQEIYPELKDRYLFQLPDSYDYKSLSSDAMPNDVKEIFNSFISSY
jgi:hypothetical protein